MKKDAPLLIFLSLRPIEFNLTSFFIDGEMVRLNGDRLSDV
jgi:hypothetical protein